MPFKYCKQVLPLFCISQPSQPMKRNKQTYYFYIISMTVSFIILALGILPYIPNQKFVMLIILSFLTAFTMFKIASKKDPGVIRKNNEVPFLKILYKCEDLGHFCPHCETPAYPLSKHCITCHHCVEDWDHHCYFLDNCIGQG